MKPETKQYKTLSPHQAALKVVQRLRGAGFQALWAGGSVRDMLLGKRPKDYDITTNAVPKEVIKLFRRTLSIGAKFGVVVVLIGGRQVEVATFRSDQSYQDGRRPDKVVFTDARHDALRRDFTINGMFYDPLKKEVIDYVGGQADLKKHVIRAIGRADERFAEDHLRMLRAIRFAGRLQYHIAPATWKAICKHAAKINKISSERIAMELEQILVDPNRASGIQLVADSGLGYKILNNLSRDQLKLGISVIGQLPRRCSFDLALAGLLCACDEETAGQIGRDLKTSNQLRRHVQWLVGSREKLLTSIPLSKGHLKKWLSQPLFETLITLCRAWLRAHGRPQTPLRQLRRQIRNLGDEPISPPAILDGHDLIKLGAVSGPMVGQLAEELYLAQLENEVKTGSQARSWAKAWLNRHKE
ncbi:MAG: CCA tRNA nucleotidyltransferase [Sedimentisphaerales bacterium]|nr:CCA tRNA nucleotidyltransferase [Sedimentisphaerales bacterium]